MQFVSTNDLDSRANVLPDMRETASRVRSSKMSANLASMSASTTPFVATHCLATLAFATKALTATV